MGNAAGSKAVMAAKGKPTKPKAPSPKKPTTPAGAAIKAASKPIQPVSAVAPAKDAVQDYPPVVPIGVRGYRKSDEDFFYLFGQKALRLPACERLETAMKEAASRGL